MKYTKYLSILLLITLFISCGETPLDWQLQEGNIDTIVVDAILTNEHHRHRVKITHPFADPNHIPDPITGADVSIRVNNQTYHLLELPNHPGTYINANIIDDQIGNTYFLEVNYQGKSYDARATMEPVNIFGKLTFATVPNTDSMTIKNPPPLIDEFEQAMYEINIDWSHLTNIGKTRAKIFFYTFNTIDVGQIFSPPKETVQFPRGSRVLVKKYSLSEEYAAFLRALVSESQWQGGLFEESKDNLPTNISNGGLGFFSASAVLVDSLIAQ